MTGPILSPADGLDVRTSWDGPPSVAVVRARLAELRVVDPALDAASFGATRVADALFLLSLDIRTSCDDPPDPVTVVARWLWLELKDRQRRRAEARGVLERAMRAEPPRLVFGSAS